MCDCLKYDCLQSTKLQLTALICPLEFLFVSDNIPLVAVVHQGFLSAQWLTTKAKKNSIQKKNFKLISQKAIQRSEACMKILGAKLTKKIVLRVRPLRSLCN